MLAVPAPPLPAGGDGIVLRHAAAARAGHFLALAPAQLAEQGEHLVVAHGVQPLDRQCAGLGGEEEVCWCMMFITNDIYIEYDRTT